MRRRQDTYQADRQVRYGRARGGWHDLLPAPVVRVARRVAA